MLGSRIFQGSKTPAEYEMSLSSYFYPETQANITHTLTLGMAVIPKKKQVDITISKNQILYLVYSTVLNRNLPQLSLVRETRKVTVETISK